MYSNMMDSKIPIKYKGIQTTSVNTLDVDIRSCRVITSSGYDKNNKKF